MAQRRDYMTKIIIPRVDPLSSESGKGRKVSEETEEGSSTINIPTWVVSFGKVVAPALAALVVMYFEVQDAKKDIEDLKKSKAELISDASKKLEAVKDENAKQSQEILILRLHSESSEKDIGKSLSAIETSIKSIQTDIREIQRIQLKGNVAAAQPAANP
jgi:glycerate-2-kinase